MILNWFASLFRNQPKLEITDPFPSLNVREYFKDVQIEDLNRGIYANGVLLIDTIREFLTDLEWMDDVVINSGYRDIKHNSEIGGKPKSYHVIGLAIDLQDYDRKLRLAILDQSELLNKHSLWMENPSHTPTWVHLDMATRSARSLRIFNP